MISPSKFLPGDARLAADLIVSIMSAIHNDAYMVETVGIGMKQMPIDAIIQDTTAQLLELKMTGLLPTHEHHVKFLEMGTSNPEGSTVDVGVAVCDTVIVLRIHHGRAAPKNVTYHLPGVSGEFVAVPSTRASRGLVGVLVDTYKLMFKADFAQLRERLAEVCEKPDILPTFAKLQRQAPNADVIARLDKLQADWSSGIK